MSPDEVFRQFARRYSLGAAPLDSAIAKLAEWIASRAEMLDEDDVQALILVGGTLFEKAVELGWEHPGYGALLEKGLSNIAESQQRH